MANPRASVDTRRFQELFDDAVRIATRKGPLDDSAREVLLGAAFVADQLLYRMSSLPEQLRGPMLALAGLRPAPARAASLLLEFRPPGLLTSPVTMPRGVVAATEDGTVGFTTPIDFTLVPVSLAHCPLSLGNNQNSAAYFRLDQPAPGCVVELSFELTFPGTGVDPDDPPLFWEYWDGSQWYECTVIEDGTGGLTRPGLLTLWLLHDFKTVTVDGTHGAWIRAVVDMDEDDAGYRYPITFGRVTAATAGARIGAWHARLVADEPLGTSTGEPGQRFRLRHAPVVEGDRWPVVEARIPGGEWEEWALAGSFAGSTADDMHAVLDPGTGEVFFGPQVSEPDGTTRQYGAIPLAGALLRVRDYWSGGGAAGNVPAGALRSVIDGLTLHGQDAASDGRDAETIDALWQRAPLELQAGDRAVTAADFEYLARKAAPELARVHCVADEQGTVRVLIVPAPAPGELGELGFGDLAPLPETIEAIATYLGERRLVGTRVVVEAPYYTGVGMTVGLTARRGTSPARVQQDALRALHTYLSPITGGPAKQGWPLGRTLRAGELYGVLHHVDGVDTVDELVLYTADPNTGDKDEEVTAIELSDRTLLLARELAVTVAT
ncbi:putative baseplate assembly protein [Longispora albida]|uniref:putative baseplate assembly protein n=1 Tax=Longispora albida TaxID=203523 RepID=UPI0003636DBB|nr:putative baseplate assembly protein [Longispora albida]